MHMLYDPFQLVCDQTLIPIQPGRHSSAASIGWWGAALESALQRAHSSGDEHRGDIDSIEAVLDRLKTGFIEDRRSDGIGGAFASKVQAMKHHNLA